MAIVNQEKTILERVFKCDRCGETKPFSFSNAISDISRGLPRWLIKVDSDRVLCPSCVEVIVEAWYAQKDVVNFNLQGDDVSSRKKTKSKSKVTA